MREIRIAGMNEVIVTGGRAPASSAPRFASGAVAAGFAAVALALTASTPGPAPRENHPVPVQAAIEPLAYDLSGKVANRLGGAEAVGHSAVPIRVSTAGLFGRWLDRSAPAPAAAREAATKVPAPSAQAATRRPAIRTANAAPLPPVRPALLGETGAAVAAASAEPARETPRLLGFFPSDLLPSPGAALGRVAALGDAILERVSP
ncbi:MAG TPA: hypothetical protein VF601_13215 [Beijerinckiaceae bacterium]|jgi:hypothetical protein